MSYHLDVQWRYIGVFQSWVLETIIWDKTALDEWIWAQLFLDRSQVSTRGQTPEIEGGKGQGSTKFESE